MCRDIVCRVFTPEERTTKWLVRKDQLDVKIGRTWERLNWSQDALSARNFILNEFWHIFVHDWTVERDAFNTHANAHSKSVFSFALTLMDNVLVWGRERKWIGTRCAACMWIHTQAVLCNRRVRPEVVSEQDGSQKLEGGLERRMLTIMESVNWVFEDVIKEEHEWVTQVIISDREDRVLADLDYNIDIPCVVQHLHVRICTTRIMGHILRCTTK